MPAKWTRAGTVFDEDQGIKAPQENGVHVDKIGREDAAGLDGQELLPRRIGAAGAVPVPAACRICRTVETAI